MRALFRLSFFAATFLVCSSSQLAQSQQSSKEPSGAVTGRVTAGGNPVPRVIVVANPVVANPNTRANSVPQATTDDDGRYRISGLAAGTYTVRLVAPVYVSPESNPLERGKPVVVGDGELVEGIDFSAVRGAVITGRVTDSDGRPVIDERVWLMEINDRGVRSNFIGYIPFTTDDRGVYRIYGLKAGRYKVSIGSPQGVAAFPAARFPKTFYPSATEESAAAIVEVVEGAETSGIDIQVGRATKKYAASGRIVDAVTGKPAPELTYAYSQLSSDEKRIGAYSYTNHRSGAKGEFRIEGLAPGRYAAFVVLDGANKGYCEPAIFQIVDSDISDLTIKLREGSTITGVVDLEGSDDPELLARVSKIRLRIWLQSTELAAPFVGAVGINPDRTFMITGLQPGRAQISIEYPLPQHVTALRMEHQGSTVRDIEVRAGETSSGVRIVLGYGTAIVRGQVTLKGGDLPPGLMLMAFAKKPGESQQTSASMQVDARGRFVLENLMPGEYQIIVRTVPSPDAPPVAGMRSRQAIQNVTVANGSETEVSLELDLSDSRKDGEK